MSVAYDALTALLAMIRDCMGGDACDYSLFVSLGVPPAECNSISAYLDEQVRTNNSDDCFLVTDDTFYLVLTRCCNEQEVFDPIFEDEQAECFLHDLDALKTCLACNLKDTLGPFSPQCAPYIKRIGLDAEKRGGCYSAEIEIVMSDMNCCPPPTPPPIP